MFRIVSANFRGAAQLQRSQIATFHAEYVQVVHRHALLQRKTAVILSSGNMDINELRRAKHPYSRANANSAYPPWVINRKTGRFANSWKFRVTDHGDYILQEVWNDSPAARFMLGTAKMIKRPILEKVWEFCYPQLLTWLREMQAKINSAGSSIPP